MLIFDLHHMAWRAFHTTGGMKYGKDTTGVIFGVLRELQGTLTMLKDPLIAIAADSKRSLRKEIFPGYKKRIKKDETDEEKDAREDVFKQIGTLKREIFPAIGIRNVFEYDGYEADDIMAELVVNKRKWTLPTIITGDEDLFQMLPYANMWMSTKRQRMFTSRFIDQYGIPPQLWSEVKALSGCTSDTVPGVKGIGKATAIKYLLGKLPEGKKKQAIEEAKQNGYLDTMRRLVVLPFAGTPHSVLLPTRFNKSGFEDVCNKYGLNTLAQDADIWENLLDGRRKCME